MKIDPKLQQELVEYIYKDAFNVKRENTAFDKGYTCGVNYALTIINFWNSSNKGKSKWPSSIWDRPKKKGNKYD